MSAVRKGAGADTGNAGHFAAVEHPRTTVTLDSPKPLSERAQALVDIHRRLVAAGDDPARARNHVTGLLLVKVAQAYLLHGQRANSEAGGEGTAAAYIFAFPHLRDAAATVANRLDDPSASRTAVSQARHGLRGTGDLFSGFGNNPVSTINQEANGMLDDVDQFLDHTNDGEDDR